jgi:predicted transcriptional regulator
MLAMTPLNASAANSLLLPPNHAKLPPMIRALEIAIEKLKRLPEDKQAYAAEVIEELAADEDEVFRIPDDHLPGVLEGLAQAERGEFASDEEMAALWKKCGL